MGKLRLLLPRQSSPEFGFPPAPPLLAWAWARHPRVNAGGTTPTATKSLQCRCTHRTSFLSSPPPPQHSCARTLPKITPRASRRGPILNDSGGGTVVLPPKTSQQFPPLADPLNNQVRRPATSLSRSVGHRRCKERFAGCSAV